MSTLENLDKKIEFLSRNVRGGVEDYFWIKKRTAERVLWLLFTSIDLYTCPTYVNSAFKIMYYIYILHMCPEQKSSPTSHQWVKIINWDNSLNIRVRLFISSFFLYYLTTWEFNAVAPIMYVCMQFHDNDDRGIKNWAKWKLQELRKSIKIFLIQPSPA